MNWTEVPANTTEYNITVSEENTTQFAISANNGTSSSGMVWTSCTLLHNQALTKIKEVWIAGVDSTSIEVKWKLDCADRSDRVAGYVIYYCQLTKELACQEQKNFTISDGRAESGKVDGLSPYKSYRLSVSALSAQGAQSPESDTLRATTQEARKYPYLFCANSHNEFVVFTYSARRTLRFACDERYEFHYYDRVEASDQL